jgi:hypothetical protein
MSSLEDSGASSGRLGISVSQRGQAAESQPPNAATVASMAVQLEAQLGWSDIGQEKSEQCYPFWL